VPLNAVEPADAVVALGGIFGPSTTDDFIPNIGEAGERLEAGIELWQHGKAKWLVFTGGRIPWAGPAEAEGMRARRVAIARGVPAESVVVTREVGNTVDEANAVRDLMIERGWTRIILVTSGWHMPRAARLFRTTGVSFVPFPVDFQTDPKMPLSLLDFLPHADGLRTTETVLRELLGIGFYAIFRR
jgi:uncharacterized SAM-binding protein YcdF (DUF218 family)